WWWPSTRPGRNQYERRPPAAAAARPECPRRSACAKERLGLTRRQLTAARRVVVKIGSSLLFADPPARVAALAREVAAQRARGVECVLVSSGAIALGMRRLGLAERPHAIPDLQATAADGPGHLMQRSVTAFPSRRPGD